MLRQIVLRARGALNVDDAPGTRRDKDNDASSSVAAVYNAGEQSAHRRAWGVVSTHISGVKLIRSKLKKYTLPQCDKGYPSTGGHPPYKKVTVYTAVLFCYSIFNMFLVNVQRKRTLFL